jgi:multicomponent Na+:H+ antiporter subunit D
VHAIEHAATHFVDRPAYADAVLKGHAEFVQTPPHPLKAADFLYGSAAVLGAVAVAAVALFGPRFASAPAWVHAPVAGLRGLHSGHLGDYVAWLTVALAVFGGLCALTLS